MQVGLGEEDAEGESVGGGRGGEEEVGGGWGDGFFDDV